MNRRRPSLTITEGSHNAFHRAFLYGTGLSSDEIKQPLVGVGVAWSEASTGSHLVRALADQVKSATWAAAATPREFLVPVTDAPEASRDTRELVADSIELVVRGHWYDVVVGVAASPWAIYGLAMGILRLRVPGVVTVPLGVQAGGAAALSFLGSLGVGWQSVDTEPVRADAGALRELLTALTDADTSAAEIARARCEEAPGSIRLPPVSSHGFSHAAAVLHEIGVTSLLQILTADHESRGDLEPTLVELRADGEAVAHGLCDLGPGQRGGPIGGTVIDAGDQPALSFDGRSLCLTGMDMGPPSPLEDRLVVLDGDLAPHLGRALTLVPLVGGLPAVGEQVSERLATATVGRTTHPGLVDTDLRYDRL